MVIMEGSGSEQFCREDDPVLRGSVVPYVDGVVNGKQPEIFLHLLWPMEDKMEEQGSGPIEDCLNVALHVVLTMSTGPKKTPELMLIVTIGNPLFGVEGMAVRGTVLQFDAVITQKSFKRVFAPQ